MILLLDNVWSSRGEVKECIIFRMYTENLSKKAFFSDETGERIRKRTQDKTIYSIAWIMCDFK